MALIPTLNTQRLRLRPMNLNDWPAYAAFMASDRCRHMGGPFAPDRAWGLFCADHAQWDFFGVGALMMEDHESGCCLGQVGINTGPLFPEHEIGWLVFLQAEGLGYAFEAASALRDWARDVRHLPSLVSYVHKDNTRSCRLAERLGAIPDKAATGHAPGDVVYRHFGPQAG
ncbi:MAG: GNAT family N-acetyltransferase [Acetobacter papayae]|uniref:GNAT family N-acetyltransferase n=1 Tax=Acetobacter papayae TaxID=1076592 RepID=UPI0039E77D5E